MVQASSPPAINNVHSLLAGAQSMESPLWTSGTRRGPPGEVSLQEPEALKGAMMTEDHVGLADPLVIDNKCLL